MWAGRQWPAPPLTFRIPPSQCQSPCQPGDRGASALGDGERLMPVLCVGLTERLRLGGCIGRSPDAVREY